MIDYQMKYLKYKKGISFKKLLGGIEVGQEYINDQEDGNNAEQPTFPTMTEQEKQKWSEAVYEFLLAARNDNVKLQRITITKLITFSKEKPSQNIT